MQPPLSLLQSGDHLLYRPHGFFGWVITVKTWTKVAHIEIYAGDGTSLASRDGIGVNRYAWRKDGLGYVLRPKKPLDMAAGLAWFETVRGQKYDWFGLLRFFTIGKGAQDRMFCSEFATRFDRQADFDPVAPWEDADQIAPAQFLQSPQFDLIWQDTPSPGPAAGR